MATIRIPVNELNAFDLPKICVMTGATDPTVQFRKVKFSWFPRWVYALLIINVLVMAIVARVMTKEAKGELAFSDEAWNKWRLWKVLNVFALLAFIGGMFVMIFGLASESAVGAILGVLIFIGSLVVIVLARKAGPMVESIKDDVVLIKVPNDQAAFAYQQHLSAP